MGWDPDDPQCKYDCDYFGDCGKEMSRLNTVRERVNRGIVTPTPPTAVTRVVTAAGAIPGKVGVYEAKRGGGIIRPQRPAELPPGTEYLPPETAGQHGSVQRAAAIAFTEGCAVGFSQLFGSLAEFARDITAWHPHAGKWRYGDKWDKER
jgi:hypothetical protein